MTKPRTAVVPRDLPEKALLARYAKELHYTDCFSADVGTAVTLEQLVYAFYTGSVFRLERLVLKWLASKPSTDEAASQVAAGTRDDFAAWGVEDRAENQLLMTDFRGQTRSWFMVEPVDGDHTRLFFGSAVIARRQVGEHAGKPGLTYRVLLRMHKVYSRVLLAAAARSVQ
jgi:hypothetical protein